MGDMYAGMGTMSMAARHVSVVLGMPTPRNTSTLLCSAKWGPDPEGRLAKHCFRQNTTPAKLRSAASRSALASSSTAPHLLLWQHGPPRVQPGARGGRPEGAVRHRAHDGEWWSCWSVPAGPCARAALAAPH